MSDIRLLKNEKPVFIYTSYDENGMFLNFGDIKSGSHNNIDYGYQISEDETCVSFRADFSKNILLKEEKEYSGALSNDGKTKAWLDGGKIFIN